VAIRVAGLSLAGVALVVGVAAGAAGLLAGAALTGNRVVAAAVAMLAAICSAAALSWPAARLAIAPGRRLRKWLPIGISGLASAVLTAVIAVLVFAPGPSGLPVREPDAAGYWDLPTGSRIAYTHARPHPQAQPRPAPVVFVHGGPGAARFIGDGLTGRLTAAGYDVYAYHQFGAGLSNRADDVADYTVARHVADLEAIRTTIGTERLTLVGASWGAQLVANYLAAHPQRVARAVVSGPANIWSPGFPGNTELTPGGQRDQQQALTRRPRFLLAQVMFAAAGPEATRVLLDERQLDREYEALVSDLDMKAGCAGDPAHSRSPREQPSGFGFWANAMTARDAEQVPDPRPALRGLPIDLLILRGECDYLARPVADEYRQLLPHAAFVEVRGAGHEIEADQPERYHHHISTFLAAN
jgi:proline iminopeptidase